MHGLRQARREIKASDDLCGLITMCLLRQMLLLALLHRWRPRAARRLELLALALPLPDALARLAVRPRL